jgi:hypothetical protein
LETLRASRTVNHLGVHCRGGAVDERNFGQISRTQGQIHWDSLSIAADVAAVTRNLAAEEETTFGPASVARRSPAHSPSASSRRRRRMTVMSTSGGAERLEPEPSRKCCVSSHKSHGNWTAGHQPEKLLAYSSSNQWTGTNSSREGTGMRWWWSAGHAQFSQIQGGGGRLGSLNSDAVCKSICATACLMTPVIESVGTICTLLLNNALLSPLVIHIVL